VKRKSKDNLIFDERKVKNNAIDYYRLPIDSSNLGLNIIFFFEAYTELVNKITLFA